MAKHIKPVDKRENNNSALNTGGIHDAWPPPTTDDDDDGKRSQTETVQRRHVLVRLPFQAWQVMQIARRWIDMIDEERGSEIWDEVHERENTKANATTQRQTQQQTKRLSLASDAAAACWKQHRRRREALQPRWQTERRTAALSAKSSTESSATHRPLVRSGSHNPSAPQFAGVLTHPH